MSTDKPRIRKVGEGMWVCSSKGCRKGVGCTPEEAYGEWEYWNDIQTEKIVAVRGIDVASPNLPDYTNLDRAQAVWFKGLCDDIPNLIREVKSESTTNDIKPPNESWLSVGIPNLVKKIKNWRGGNKDE